MRAQVEGLQRGRVIDGVRPRTVIVIRRDTDHQLETDAAYRFLGRLKIERLASGDPGMTWRDTSQIEHELATGWDIPCGGDGEGESRFVGDDARGGGCRRRAAPAGPPVSSRATGREQCSP